MDEAVPFLQGSRKAYNEFWKVLGVTGIQTIKPIFIYSYTVRHNGGNSMAECP